MRLKLYLTKHLIWILAIVLVSCSNGQYCTVINNSNNEVENIVFSNGFDTINHTILKEKEQASLFLDFKKVPKSDGAYSFKFTQNDTLHSRTFGYYSNGIANDTPFTIEIKMMLS